MPERYATQQAHRAAIRAASDLSDLFTFFNECRATMPQDNLEHGQRMAEALVRVNRVAKDLEDQLDWERTHA